MGHIIDPIQKGSIVITPEQYAKIFGRDVAGDRSVNRQIIDCHWSDIRDCVVGLAKINHVMQEVCFRMGRWRLGFPDDRKKR